MNDSSRYAHDGDEGYDGRSKPCIACDLDTRLRCSGCRQPVCHNCESCPNGCGDVGPVEPFPNREVIPRPSTKTLGCIHCGHLIIGVSWKDVDYAMLNHYALAHPDRTYMRLD
jgi:hypothetical protein